MKYLRKDVALGCLQRDRNKTVELKQKLADAQTALGVVKARQLADYTTWRENVEELIGRVDDGEGLYQEQYQNSIYSPIVTGGRARRLGEAQYNIRRANEAVEEAYQAVINQRPSALTVFLTGIDDEFVTDAGIKAAGFDHGGLGRLVVLGKQGDS